MDLQMLERETYGLALYWQHTRSVSFYLPPYWAVFQIGLVADP